MNVIAPRILTPDQRVRVFISSTLEELADERAAARRAIETLHLAPVFFESGARPHPPRDMYLAYLDQSDVFVGIYWQRYGWVSAGKDISGLEDEYRSATGKPMLLYLKRPALEQEPRLTTFIDSIRDAGAVSYRTFTTPLELERFLLDDLAVLLSEKFHDGTMPPRRPRGLGGSLPEPTSSFVGRGIELERAASALRDSRMVTLVGPGGVGKTRIALRVANEVGAGVADGACFCDLAPVRDAEAVDDAIAVMLSITSPPGKTTRESIVEFLRDKELLLLLDNCEHLLAGVAMLVEVLEQSCARLMILATSREALGVDGEHLVPVPPLPTPAVDADLSAIVEVDAVRLFVERAVAVKPDFTVTAESAAAVAAICRRLDGMALAIELAAARVRAMTPAEIEQRLDRRFSLLAGGRRGAVGRHQTLRAAIDWSFALLNEREQRLLERMTVFAGGCTLSAVEAVCGGNGIDTADVFELLMNLVARSLVVAEPRRGATRYRLLETIRQYGEERLDATDDAERWSARHADHYATFLERVREHDPDTIGDQFWVTRLAAEQDNLLAAWSWAIDTGDVDIAFRILAGFAPCEVWSCYPLLLPSAAALTLPGAVDHDRYALALAVAAMFASTGAATDAAEELCRQAIDANASREVSDWRVEETVCAARQNVANVRGSFAEAARLAEQAARLALAGGDIADASVELTIAAADRVLVDEADSGLKLASEALTLARQIAAPALVASGLLAVGVAVADTDPDRARACLAESREITSALGHQNAIDLVWATGLASRTNDAIATLELGRDAILGLRWGGDRLRMGFVLHMIAGGLASLRPTSAAILQGAVETYVVGPPHAVGTVVRHVEDNLDDTRASELRARGAAMAWDEAIAYAMSEATQVLDDHATAAARRSACES